MAKDLSLQTGIDNTDGDFLNGKIKNNQTLAGKGVNQDIVQFFQKLMSNAGFVANGNEDNEVNGYQFVDALLKFVNDGLLTKVIEIGNWDMDADSFKFIAHGIAGGSNKIKTVYVAIRKDSDENDIMWAIDSGSPNVNGTYSWDDDNINPSRAAGELFDSTVYDETSYNRGWITIRYEL
jgi:hypothetical protein